MSLTECRFETERLRVVEWHSVVGEDRAGDDLSEAVAALLSPAVTRHLHPSWQGDYSPVRAARWVDERDAEGAVLLAVGRDDGEPVGLMILGSEDAEERRLRLGYLLAESSWGRGFATELVVGFVEWCRANGVESIAGGVEPGNGGSIRVLEKVGFSLDVAESPSPGGELIYRLDL